MLQRLRWQLPLAERALAVLAFRTASRVGDLLPLTADDIKVQLDGSLLIVFRETKTNQEQDPRPDHQVIVPEPELEIRQFLRTRRSLSRNHKLWGSLNADRLSRKLHTLQVPNCELARWKQMDPRHEIRPTYSLHSLKRGAAFYAWQAVAEGTITVQDLCLLLKHKDVATAIEYCPAPGLAARACGSRAGLVTRLQL